VNYFEIACGGVAAGRPHSDTRQLALDVQGKSKNVHLRISDISRSMVSELPELLLDLLEIAAYVYCADQHARRGSEKLTQAGSSWRRSMRFVIPVRHPEVWSSAEVLEPLVETLSFLSDDVFEFDFVAGTVPFVQPDAYFPELAEDCGADQKGGGRADCRRRFRAPSREHSQLRAPARVDRI
jgi:hypothetical protein